MTERVSDEPQVGRSEPASRRRWLALVVVLTGQFMASLDTTVGNVAAPSIARDLGVGGGTAALAVAAYTLLYASVLITGARLGADRGRRRVFLTGIAVFTLASGAAGLAPSGPLLIAARAAQGLGAALAIPQIITFIQADFVGRARARALATYATMISLGASVGLAVGGALIAWDVAGLGWRAVFLVNLPIGAAVLVLARWLLPTIPSTSRRLDLTGVALLTTGAAACAGPLALGPDVGWTWWTWLLLVGGMIVLAGFARWQRRQANCGRSPLLDPAIISVRGVRPGLIALLASSTTYTGVLYCVAAQLQERHGSSAVMAGLTLLPFAIGFGLGSAVGSVVALPRHRLLILLGLLVQAAGLLTLGAVVAAGVADGNWPTAAAGMLLGITGLGYGAEFSPLLGLTIVHVDRAHLADASGISTTTFQFSFVLGVAAFGSVYAAHTLATALVAMGALTLVAVIPAQRLG